MNDALKNRSVSVEQARENLLAMIEILKRSNEDVEIILLTMNPVGGDPARRLPDNPQSRSGLPSYYQMVRDVASSRNLRLIDVNKAWIAWIAENPGKFDLMVPDGIHPNENGCREIVLPAVLEGLRL